MLMDCPKCGSNTIVRLVRQMKNETVRVRACKVCGKRFYTVETLAEYTDGMDKISDWYREYYQKRKEKHGDQSEIPRKH